MHSPRFCHIAKGNDCETVVKPVILAIMELSPAIQTLANAVRDVPDFPKPGILFKDITPVLADPALLSATIDGMIAASGITQVDKVIGIDARGFIFGSLIAAKLNAGFIPIRKKGNLN